MSLTKTTSQVENNLTLVAGAGDDIGAAQDVRNSFGGHILIKLTNGGTGPSEPAQVQVQESDDATKWYDKGGPYKGTTGDGEVSSWKHPYNIDTMYIRTVQGKNIGQNVILDEDIVKITEL